MTSVEGLRLKVLHVIPHGVAVQDSVQQQQHLGKLSDGVLCRRTPGDACVLRPSGMKSQVVRIKRDDNSFLSRRKIQLVGIRQAAPSGFLCRQHIDTVSA